MVWIQLDLPLIGEIKEAEPVTLMHALLAANAGTRDRLPRAVAQASRDEA